MIIVEPRHKVEVVPVRLEKHPNADTLSIVKVWDFSCCVRTQDFLNIDRAAYVPPDSLVPTDRPYFKFLADKVKVIYGGKARIKVTKLRGVISMGLLVAPPPGSNWQVGQDLASELGVEHFEPPTDISTSGDTEAPPPDKVYIPKYDVENWRRYAQCFVENEIVAVTEKIHGASGRWCYSQDRFWAGSKSEWKIESEANAWWKALKAHPKIMDFLKSNPDVTLYGEVYGWVQELRYGAQKGQVHIAVFDLLRKDQWISFSEAREEVGKNLPWVPLIKVGGYYKETIADCAEGQSLLFPGHIREGCVVKPVQERWEPSIGRVQLKIVGNGYLSM